MFLLCAFAMSSFAIAQPAQVNGEFIESSSPLRDGGNVTTRAEPGRRIQTTVTLPRRVASRQLNTGAIPTPLNQGGSVLETSGSSTRNANQNALTSTGGYPYPANYSPRVSANPYQPNPNRVSASRVQLANNNCNCAPVPVNGLGLTAVPTFNSVPRGAVVPTAGFQANRGLVGQGVQPILSQPPQLQIQVPGQPQVAVPQYGGVQYGGVQNGVPPFGTPYTRSPWVTGSPGAYQPLVRVFNMPQGSFLGQGIVGQPEAYVNGQPIANFFRYLLPF